MVKEINGTHPKQQQQQQEEQQKQACKQVSKQTNKKLPVNKDETRYEDLVLHSSQTQKPRHSHKNTTNGN